MRRLKQLQDALRALGIARELRAHDAWSADRLARHQRRMLTRLVRHAATRSRFYAELYEGVPLGEEVELRALPVTNKRMLMDDFDAVVTDPRLKLDRLRDHLRAIRRDAYYLGRYRVVATAGTSGLRGVFVYDRPAWSTVLANTVRWTRFAGIEPRWPRRLRVCSIGADNPMHVSQRIPESGDVGLFKVLHLEATQPLPRLVAALNAFQAQVIMPYPSVAGLLAGEQLAGRLRIRPEVVAAHSEVLTEETVRRIEAAWGVTPFNHYGLTEEPHVGCDCSEHRGVHLFEDVCIVEVVDEEGRPVAPGVLGAKYLLTNLYNRVQPLIRYEVTDMLARAAEPCPCGRPLPLITRIGGRSEDILRLEDAAGREIAVPPMAISLRIEAVPDVAEYRARHGPDGIHLTVVPRAGADPEMLRGSLTKELRAGLEALGAVPPPVHIDFVGELERDRARMGKVKLVGASGEAGT